MGRSLRGRARPWLAAAAVLLAGGDSAAQTPSAARPLDVPFLSQSEALCGGAAAAMALRYWGARAVQAGDFAPLLNARRDGIETRVLVDAISTRGWQALAFNGSLSALRHHVAGGRPVIALVGVGRGRFHYVVVVALDGNRIIYHDPAIGPLQDRSHAVFDRAWAASSRWMLLVLPAQGSPIATTAASPPPPPPPPPDCAESVARAAEAAQRKEFADAESWLERAHAECPRSAVPLRELSGVRLLQRRPNAAAILARAAVGLDARDAHAWRVLGTSEFLRRDPIAALRAWNRAGEPLLDIIRVEGSTRTRHRVVTERSGLVPGQLLTPDALLRARRRLAALPTAAATQVDVVPVGSGLAEVKAAVLERPVVVTAPLALAALGVRALVTREATWQVAGLTGGGERLDLSGRWWHARPAVALGLSLPLDAGIHGVLRFEGGFSRETFAPADGPAIAEERRHAAVSLSDWTARGLRWEGTLRADRWAHEAPMAGMGASVEQRLVDDRVAVRLRGDLWPSGAFGAASLGLRARRAHQGTDRLLVAVTATVAGSGAPRALWPGAGTGPGRALLLRAHPLLDDEGIVAGGAFGRRVLHGSAEWRQPVAALGPLRVQVAAFLDAAAATRGDRDAREVDAGIGLRLRVPGEGTLRLDYGRGLRDGADAVSVGWDLPWPSWP